MEKIEIITKEVCEELIKPREKEIEEEGLYISETLSKLGELGFFSVSSQGNMVGLDLVLKRG